MKLTVTLDIEDYVYEFYKTAASDMGISIEEVLSSALYMYAGIVAMEMEKRHKQKKNNKTFS